METVFITGANRGIGLELVRQYSRRPETVVFAACRNPDQAEALRMAAAEHPDQVHILALEVTDAAQRRQAAQQVSQHTDHLDILINNAAINPPEHTQTFATMEDEALLTILNVNSVAPLMMTQALVGLLKRSPRARVVNISSEMGSLTHRTYGGDYGYCTSKAALNMITRALAVDLKPDGILSICLDPGWVQTDMGGKSASLTPAQSVSGILRVIDGLKPSQNGSYLRWNGTTLPW